MDVVHKNLLMMVFNIKYLKVNKGYIKNVKSTTITATKQSIESTK
jgi:hypothetical protein